MPFTEFTLFDRVPLHHSATMTSPHRSNLTLVFTDSRGKSLDAFVENEAILVKAYSGAKLINIVNYAATHVWELNPARVLFIGGTCDLTVKSHATQRIRPRFMSSNTLISYMMGVLRQARALARRLFPGVVVAFGGLCGVNLNKYNRCFGYHSQQTVIDRVIDPINWEIKRGNMALGIVHPTLTGKIHRRSSTRGNRNQYRLLYDGVHLGDIVVRDWAKNINKFHYNN